MVHLPSSQPTFLHPMIMPPNRPPPPTLQKIASGLHGRSLRISVTIEAWPSQMFLLGVRTVLKRIFFALYRFFCVVQRLFVAFPHHTLALIKTSNVRGVAPSGRKTVHWTPMAFAAQYGLRDIPLSA